MPPIIIIIGGEDDDAEDGYVPFMTDDSSQIPEIPDGEHKTGLSGWIWDEINNWEDW